MPALRPGLERLLLAVDRCHSEAEAAREQSIADGDHIGACCAEIVRQSLVEAAERCQVERVARGER